MRISTNQIYNAGTLGVQRNQNGLYSLQNQLSTGRRVLTPADDPVAAAQALVVGQSREVVAQHIDNQGAARAQLGQVESTLSSVGDLIQDIRESVVQAGNTLLTPSDRGFIATELEARLEELLGLANTADGAGQFMFSGYQGTTRPFAINGGSAPAFPAEASPVQYFGDDGERLLQVGASRQVATNLSGNDIFMDIKAGNGTFVTGIGNPNTGTATISASAVNNTVNWHSALAAHGGFRIEFEAGPAYRIFNASDVEMTAAAIPYVAGSPIAIEKTTAPAENFGATVSVSGVPAAGDRFTITPTGNYSGALQGSAQIDEGSVLNPVTWQQGVDTYGGFSIRFVDGGKKYEIFDAAGNSLTAPPLDYTSGQAIQIRKTTAPVEDFGAQVVITGAPAHGDIFTVAPSKAQSVFQTVQNLIGLLREPVGSTSFSANEFTNRLGFELTNLDRTLDNINTGRADIGARLRELDSLTNASEDLELQHSTTLSELQDLDYAAAISTFTQRQLQLEAAQRSFAQISRLSLFSII